MPMSACMYIKLYSCLTFEWFSTNFIDYPSCSNTKSWRFINIKLDLKVSFGSRQAYTFFCYFFLVSVDIVVEGFPSCLKNLKKRYWLRRAWKRSPFWWQKKIWKALWWANVFHSPALPVYLQGVFGKYRLSLTQSTQKHPVETWASANNAFPLYSHIYGFVKEKERNPKTYSNDENYSPSETPFTIINFKGAIPRSGRNDGAQTF